MDFSSYFLHVKALLNQFGYKNSMKRFYILKLLYETKDFLDADEIQLLLKTIYNEKISLSSVYKELNILRNLNLLSTLQIEEQKQKYKIDTTFKKEYLICLKCNKVIELDSNSLRQSAKQVSSSKGFELLDYKLSLYGYCEDCSKECEDE